MTVFDPSKHPREIESLMSLGASVHYTAKHLGMSAKKLNRWAEVYPQVAEAMREGGLNADAEVAAALYRKAIGYKYKEVLGGSKIEKIAQPDFQAAKFWLTNRQPELWSDNPKPEVVITGNENTREINFIGAKNGERVVKLLGSVD